MIALAWRLLRDTVQAWSDDYAPSMGAALAYYTFFSMAPLLLLVIFVAGLVFGPEAAQGQLMSELAGLLGPEAARSIQDVVASVSRPTESLVGAVISSGVVLVGATSVFAELQNALDRIWHAPPRPKSGLLTLLQVRLLSFGMVLGLSFLLLVSLALSALISALGQWSSGAFGSWMLIAETVNLLVGFGLTTTVFAMIYKFMPNVTVAWKDVWIGALVTAALFSIGRLLISLYLGRSGITTTYGAAGSLIIVLVWIYYSAQVFLLGAEFTWVYARHRGSRRLDQQTPQNLREPDGASSRQGGPAKQGGRGLS